MNGPHTPVSEDGKAAAAPPSTHELDELQRLWDKADIAEAQAREAAPAGAAMSHDEFMAQLDEEDRQEDPS